MFLLPVLCALSLFSTAFLSFAIQPMLGKMMLPLVGGAPAGWIVAMAFFQMALLGGYGVSYVLGRFSPWIHGMALLGLYGLGFSFLPPQMAELDGNVHGVALSLSVTDALARTILVPFLALTATTSALQRVFAATRHPTASDPYYLFVASNAGSLIGLFAYPFLMEPNFGLRDQAQGWFVLYGVVVALIIGTCLLAWRYRAMSVAKEVETDSQKHTHISAKQIGLWLVLAFVPCSLSMGVTTLITTDMPGIPLIWVLPLGLYLVTFIVAFARRPLLTVHRAWRWQMNAVGCLLVVLVVGAIWNIGFKPSGNVILYVALGLLLMEVFFATALACHLRLAQLRPAVNKLALYYFMLALGGCLAGIMHAFILPFVLPDVYEFPIMMLLALLLIPNNGAEAGTLKRWTQKYDMLLSVIAILAVGFSSLAFDLVADKAGVPFMSAIFVFVVCFMLVSGSTRHLFLVGIAVVVCTYLAAYSDKILLLDRNFFGARTVSEKEMAGKNVRLFSHGVTLHGLELLDKDDDFNRYRSTYYARGNPISDVLAIHKTKEWAVVGLGAGQVACHDPSIVTDFYEIDPDVEDVARTYFTYLEECPPRDVVIGDGLLELVRLNRVYDVILLDAFSSDAVPMHLLTLDAVRHYRTHLKADGVMLFHISNRVLDLAPALTAAAHAEGLEAFTITHKPDEKKTPLVNASRWLAIPLNVADHTAFEQKGWKKGTAASRPWTDDRSSLFDALIPDLWKKD